MHLSEQLGGRCRCCELQCLVFCTCWRAGGGGRCQYRELQSLAFFPPVVERGQEVGAGVVSCGRLLFAPVGEREGCRC